MTRARGVRCCVLLAVVLLLADARDTFARQRITCATIHADETVAAVARRLTGDARNVEAPWFQIVNPTTARRVPKTRYTFIFAGWNACVVDRPAPEATSPAIELVAQTPSTLAVSDVLPSRPVSPTAPLVAVWVPAAAWGLSLIHISEPTRPY